jgi:hypothetical protein
MIDGKPGWKKGTKISDQPYMIVVDLVLRIDGNDLVATGEDVSDEAKGALAGRREGRRPWLLAGHWGRGEGSLSAPPPLPATHPGRKKTVHDPEALSWATATSDCGEGSEAGNSCELDLVVPASARAEGWPQQPSEGARGLAVSWEDTGPSAPMLARGSPAAGSAPPSLDSVLEFPPLPVGGRGRDDDGSRVLAAQRSVSPASILVGEVAVVLPPAGAVARTEERDRFLGFPYVCVGQELGGPTGPVVGRPARQGLADILGSPAGVSFGGPLDACHVREGQMSRVQIEQGELPVVSDGSALGSTTYKWLGFRSEP